MTAPLGARHNSPIVSCAEMRPFKQEVWWIKQEHHRVEQGAGERWGHHDLEGLGRGDVDHRDPNTY